MYHQPLLNSLRDAVKHDTPWEYATFGKCLNEEQVKEKVYSNFGSRHGVKRRYITINSIDEIDPSESSAPVVVSHFRDK